MASGAASCPSEGMSLSEKIIELKNDLKRLRTERLEASKALRNYRRRQSRLKRRAGGLSEADLRYLLHQKAGTSGAGASTTETPTSADAAATA
jgi:hypothetical protein